MRVLPKTFEDNKHNSLHLVREYARISVLGHYLSIFSRQMGAIVYLAVHHLNIITAKFTNSRQNTNIAGEGRIVSAILHRSV